MKKRSVFELLNSTLRGGERRMAGGGLTANKSVDKKILLRECAPTQQSGK